jgi:CheY-like chemotaxis protein
VSRITRDSIQLHKKPGDLRQVLREAIQSTLPQVEAKHQQLTIQLPPDPVYVNGDMLRLEQAVGNIIANASKYSAAEGHILVRCEVMPEVVEIRVKDNGVGIPREKLSSIFNLFAQVDHPLTRAGGLGIGLTIARRLVALHGGTIDVSSDGVGHGSEFVVRLPVVGAEAHPMLGLNAGDAAPVHRSPLGVLLIEDNEDTREVMRNLLERWGHQVSVAADGETGLGTAQNTHPDVALINIALPGIDGYQVARNLRASTAGKEMLLVALTGYGRREDRARALECGFDLHLMKPVQPEKLYGILAQPPVAAKRQRA